MGQAGPGCDCDCVYVGRVGIPVGSSQDTRPQTQGSQDLLGLTAASHPLQFVPGRRESWEPVYLRFGRVPVTLISLCLHHPDAGLLPDPDLSPGMVLNHRETPTDVWKVLPYCMDRCSQEGRSGGGLLLPLFWPRSFSFGKFSEGTSAPRRSSEPDLTLAQQLLPEVLIGAGPVV